MLPLQMKSGSFDNALIGEERLVRQRADWRRADAAELELFNRQMPRELERMNVSMPCGDETPALRVLQMN